LYAAGGFAATAAFSRLAAQTNLPKLKITGFELIPVRATARTVWLFLRLKSDAGITGLGEVSDAFGFANTTAANAATMRSQLQKLFALIEGGSPFDIEMFRQKGDAAARQGLIPATAYSGIEQAMWDLAGKALKVPAYSLFGGKVRDRLPVYANINRATNPRTPEGFAAAATRAMNDGFRAFKAAPFDGFPAPGSPASAIEAAIETGIACAVAMRERCGSNVEIMIDCHSFFSVEQAVRVAERLDRYKLRWYEEPVAPENVDQTLEIKRRIRQPMAGGEVLFGVTGFADLIRRHAVDVVMPDVKHCGGLLELSRIAAMASTESIDVAPHNPSGPVSTAASVQICAGMKNFNYLELQYGETEWRSEVIRPRERFVQGMIDVPDRPGFGIDLDDDAIRRRTLPL
jgi:galactonate dehydratase